MIRGTNSKSEIVRVGKICFSFSTKKISAGIRVDLTESNYRLNAKILFHKLV